MDKINSKPETKARPGDLMILMVFLFSLIVIHLWFPINGDDTNSEQNLDENDGGSSETADQVRGLTDINFGEELTCKHLDEIDKISVIGEGAVKTVWLAKFKHHLITLSELKSELYQDDFNHNRHMLKILSTSHRVVKLYGTCNNSIVTQFHPLGNPLYLTVWTRLRPGKIITGTSDCLKLCLQYVDLVNFFHTHPSGPLVMCDSNSLEKLLSQLLLSINEDSIDGEGLKLIANDLDALPSVKPRELGIKCGPREVFGNFVAPEQLWPYPDRPFNFSEMPGYTEKIDIWKIPDVCSWFIKLSTNSDLLLKSLKPIHDQCKQMDPDLRPEASKVYQFYLKRYKELISAG